MSQKAKKIVHLSYGILLSLMILAVGIALILSCIDIYRSGNRPFSRESIAAAFDRIDVLVYITIGLVLGGIVLSVALPLDRLKPKAMRDEYDTLAALREKVGNAVPQREPKFRLILRAAVAAVSIALGIYPLLYFFDLSHFGLEDINGNVISAALPALVWAAVTLVLAFVCSLLCRKSVRREIAQCKQAMQDSTDRPAESAAPCLFAQALETAGKPIKLWIRLSLLAIAIVFIVLGVLNGGIDDVLGKAIRICTECIGLG